MIPAKRSQLNVAVAKQSTKASMNLQRLSQGAKRTKARSCSALFSSSLNSKRTKHKTLRSGHWRSCWPNRQLRSWVLATTSWRLSVSERGVRSRRGKRRVFRQVWLLRRNSWVAHLLDCAWAAKMHQTILGMRHELYESFLLLLWRLLYVFNAIWHFLWRTLEC